MNKSCVHSKLTVERLTPSEISGLFHCKSRWTPYFKKRIGYVARAVREIGFKTRALHLQQRLMVDGVLKSAILASRKLVRWGLRAAKNIKEHAPGKRK
jgi:hypothetical protein